MCIRDYILRVERSGAERGSSLAVVQLAGFATEADRGRGRREDGGKKGRGYGYEGDTCGEGRERTGVGEGQTRTEHPCRSRGGGSTRPIRGTSSFLIIPEGWEVGGWMGCEDW